MQDLMQRLMELHQEGSEKFVALSAAGSAVRNFADATRENSAADYDYAKISKVAVATVESSVMQSGDVYKMFAQPQSKR